MRDFKTLYFFATFAKLWLSSHSSCLVTQAKRAKLEKLAHENHLRAAQEERDRERVIKNAIDQAAHALAVAAAPGTMAPPAPRTMAPPAPKQLKVLPAGFFDNIAAAETTCLAGAAAVAGVQRLMPTAVSTTTSDTLPAGFFDDSSAATALTQQQSGLGLVSYGSDDDDEGGHEASFVPALVSAAMGAGINTAPPSSSSSSSAAALPAGFFDNEDKDMRARGLDPEAEAKAAEVGVDWGEVHDSTLAHVSHGRSLGGI
jgi:hypothetical protein